MISTLIFSLRLCVWMCVSASVSVSEGVAEKRRRRKKERKDHTHTHTVDPLHPFLSLLFSSHCFPAPVHSLFALLFTVPLSLSLLLPLTWTEGVKQAVPGRHFPFCCCVPLSPALLLLLQSHADAGAARDRTSEAAVTPHHLIFCHFSQTRDTTTTRSPCSPSCHLFAVNITHAAMPVCLARERTRQRSSEI